SGEAAARADNVVREAAAGGRTAAAVERAAKGNQPMVGGEGVRERSQQRRQSLRLTAVHQTPLASQKHRRHRLLPRQRRRLRPMVGRGKGRERTQQRHQSLRQTAAQRRPLTSRIRL
ncbi:unnamed protein product, partial [Pylaiella littoralis]